MNPEIAKYLLMMQLSTPASIPVSTYMPLLNSNSTGIELRELTHNDAHQLVFNKVITRFNEETEQYNDLICDNIESAQKYFYKTIELLSPMNPDNIIFSLTSSESLYFRIYKGDEEITLEVFYSQYDDEDNIEAVIAVYRDEVLEKRDFGQLNDVFINTLYSTSSVIDCVAPEYEYA